MREDHTRTDGTIYAGEAPQSWNGRTTFGSRRVISISCLNLIAQRILTITYLEYPLDDHLCVLISLLDDSKSSEFPTSAPFAQYTSLQSIYSGKESGVHILDAT